MNTGTVALVVYLILGVISGVWIELSDRKHEKDGRK